MSTGIKFSEVLKVLNQNYPLNLAEKWDNVGLLVEPSNINEKEIKKIFLTIDLTEPVFDEAIKKGSDFIISYHPPLFSTFKQVTQKTVSQRLAIKAIENRVPIYSPHSILDSIKNGMNDWMAKGLLSMTNGKGTYRPLEPVQTSVLSENGLTHKLVVNSYSQDVIDKLSSLQRIHDHSNGTLEYQTNLSQLTNIIDILNEFKSKKISYEIQALVEKIPSPSQGPGRLVTLDSEVPIEKAIECIKELFNQKFIRIARPLPESLQNKPIKTISICPGSGGMMIFSEKADLYLTGELKHHEILDACAKGSYVIVCDHSNSERGFLPDYRQNLLNLFNNKVTIEISQLDKDPLSIV